MANVLKTVLALSDATVTDMHLNLCKRNCSITCDISKKSVSCTVVFLFSFLVLFLFLGNTKQLILSAQ